MSSRLAASGRPGDTAASVDAAVSFGGSVSLVEPALPGVLSVDIPMTAPDDSDQL